MKTTTAIILMFLASLQMSAQTIKDVVKSMPDSITPMLTRNNILNFIDYLEAGEKAIEKNRLGGQSQMTHLTDTRTTISTSASSSIDIKLIKNPETAIGIITTVRNANGTTLSSVVRYYTTDWKLTRTIIPEDFTSYSWTDDGEELIPAHYDPLKLDNVKFEK